MSPIDTHFGNPDKMEVLLIITKKDPAVFNVRTSIPPLVFQRWGPTKDNICMMSGMTSKHRVY